MTLLISMPAGAEFILLFGIGIITAFIFYIISLQSAFNAISLSNIKMSPGQVWLLLIPVLGIIWQFILVIRLADSIKAEAISKNIEIHDQQIAYNIGLAMCILTCVSFIPAVKIFAEVGAFICWIIYWLKIAAMKKQITNLDFYNADNTN